MDILYADTLGEEIEEWNASNIKGFLLYSTSERNRLNRVLTENGWVVSSLQIPYSVESIKAQKEFEECGSFVYNGLSAWDKVYEILSDLLNKYPGISVKSRKVKRDIDRQNVKCVEEKEVHIVEIGDLKYGFMGSLYELKDVVDYLYKVFLSQKVSFYQKRVWTLSNRIQAILSPDIVAYIFNFFVKEFLNGSSPKVKLDEKILNEINISDDPLYKWSPSFSTFDDEGVKTKKKELIGDGFVVNYLGTIYSKHGNPGNARGYVPAPDYFTLLIEGGDWKLNELIEDTKEGVLVSGVRRAELVDNSIRIVPKSVRTLKGEELKIREIAVPYQDLLSINAMTKDVLSVPIDESHGVVAPYVRMNIRVILY